MKAVAALSVLILLLLAPPAVSRVPDDKLIVPGKRIGKWTLQMTIADLVRMNGPATRTPLYRAGEPPTADIVRDFTLVNWSRGRPGQGSIVALTFDQKTVIGLILGSSFVFDVAGWQLYKTDKGIGLKSTRDQVLRVYGKPTAETTPAPGQTTLIYDKIGIAFRVYADGTMSDIFVFRPGTAKTIWKF